MDNPVIFALVLLFLLQTKHLFADFFLQTSRMLQNRGTYLHLGRAQHAGIHAAGSLIVMAAMGVPISLSAIVAVIEWAVHFHVDWGKARWSDITGDEPHQARFWQAFGTDQALHQWTYLVMVWSVLP